MEIDAKSLLQAAAGIRGNAHAPYSRFNVGAAILTEDGQVYTGVNVENAAYPLGACAEGNAIGTMVGAGASRYIVACAVAAGGEGPCTPCGGCRQKLFEFGSNDTIILIGDADGDLVMETTLGALLPEAFGPGHLPVEQR